MSDIRFGQVYAHRRTIGRRILVAYRMVIGPRVVADGWTHVTLYSEWGLPIGTPASMIGWDPDRAFSEVYELIEDAP